MSPKLKKLGVALVAVVALSLVAGSTASAVQFTAEKYPTTFEPTGTEGTGVFETEAGASKCKKIATSATLSEASSTATVNATFSECSSFGFPTTVIMNGCYYVMHVKEGEADKYKGSGDLVCPAGKEVFGKMTSLGSTICEIHIPPQVGAVQIEFIDQTLEKRVEGKVTSSAVHYTVTLDTFPCPFNGLGTHANGKAVQSQPALIGGKEKPAVID